VNELPAESADSAAERAVGGESAADLELTGFDAELAATLADFGERVRPREFDSRAILRRTARRKTSQLLGTAAAGLAVLAGAAVFATRVGPIAASDAAASATASQPAAPGSADPLTLPGYFRTTPSGSTPFGHTAYGASSGFAAYPGSVAGDNALMVIQDPRAGSGPGGTEYDVSVDWVGGYIPDIAAMPFKGQFTQVGTVNGHPAYLSAAEGVLAFWTGSARGYALVHAWNITQGLLMVKEPTVLLNFARAFDTTSVAVPLPLRITGLDSAQVTSASLGQADAGSNSESLMPGSAAPDSWYAQIGLVIDGRTYYVTANPGSAITPQVTPKMGNGSSFVSAARTVDGLGVMVSTEAGDKGGSPSAPTVSQVLSHVTSLGTDPSGWTTDVITK
jgi:hypothetical protein